MDTKEEKRDQRVGLLLTPSELKAVDDWGFDQRIRNRNEAIRQLIMKGLETGETKKPKGR